MRQSTFDLRADDGVELHVVRFEPASVPPRAVVLVAHGMAEHGARYERVAEALTAAGYAVYVVDHRGHGKSARRAEDLGFFAERDGWNRVVRDLDLLRQRIVEEHRRKQVFLLGHSMGSLLAQHFVAAHGAELAGVVLSGTGGGAGALARVGRGIAKLERLRLGARGRSKLLQSLTFGQYNRGFEPVRTEYDWLSRDPSEVDKYVADPLCGFDMTVQGWIDVLSGVITIESAANIAKVPKRLPFYLFSGELDPVGRQTRGVKWLAERYRRAGVTDVTTRFYVQGRHEMFNETNRDEVVRDLVGWLDGVLARSAAQ